MVAIIGEGYITDDRKLVVTLPEDIFIGWAKLTIEPFAVVPGVQHSVESDEPVTYEIARTRLLAAGSLATNLDIPADLVALTDEEFEGMSLSFPPARPTEDYIDEDRGDC